MQINQYANETHDLLRIERLVLLSWAIQTQKSHTTYTALDLKFRKRPQQKFKKEKEKKSPQSCVRFTEVSPNPDFSNINWWRENNLL